MSYIEHLVTVHALGALWFTGTTEAALRDFVQYVLDSSSNPEEFTIWYYYDEPENLLEYALRNGMRKRTALERW